MRLKVPLLGLWALSLGLRALFLAGVDVRETLRADASHYVALAWNLANRGSYSISTRPPPEPHLRFPPGYPLLLAPFFVDRDDTGGVGPIMLAPVERGARWAMRAQVLLGSLVPVLVVLVGLRIMPAWPAWIAGLLTACCPVLVTTCAFLVSEAAFTWLLLLAALALGRELERPTTAGAIGAGALCGFLALVRSFALLLPAVAALHLALRGIGPGRRRAAVVLLVTATAVVAPWYVRNRLLVARGVPAVPYLAQALALSLYPGLRSEAAPGGYPHLADPDFPRFSTSVPGVLAELGRRVKADPGPQLRWHLLGRWLTLWQFHEIQSPPIHVYPVKRGLFRPAALDPEGRAEPLAALYWTFRGLYYLSVPAALLGPLVARRRWRGAPTPGGRTLELLYLLLAYTVVVNGMIYPLPRYMWPARPLLYLLATWTVVELLRRWRAMPSSAT
jgi:4-amino-4-deoxy-L-arabinose transferase-like glycosyltransferase